MFNNESLNTFLEVLETHGYDYTEYKHQNGKCCIKTNVLINQLKLNEESIRKQTIEDFVKKIQEKEESLFLQDYGGFCDNSNERSYNNGILAMDDLIEDVAREMCGLEETNDKEMW